MPSQAQRDIIFELRRIAFDGDTDPTGTEKRKAIYTKDYKMLGFTVSLYSTLYCFKSKNKKGDDYLDLNLIIKVFCFFPLPETQNHLNPAMDFTQTPPGMLALDNMLYLARVHQDTYIRVSAGIRHD